MLIHHPIATSPHAASCPTPRSAPSLFVATRALATTALATTALATSACGPGGMAASAPSTPVNILVEHVGPTPLNTDLHAIRGASTSGRMSAVAMSPDGRRVYAGTPHSGLWRSDDGGAHFRQITRVQIGDLPPGCRPGVDPGCDFPGATILDIAVWPRDPDLVFVATGKGKKGAPAGVYRSANGGQSWRLVHATDCGLNQPSAPAARLAFAPDDDTQLWVAGCSVAYSTLGGPPYAAPPATTDVATLRGQVGVQWTRSGYVPPGGQDVWQLAISPAHGRTRRVWACGPRVVLVSDNGGVDFSALLTANTAISGACGSPEGGLTAFHSTGTGAIAVDPFDPDRLYVAGQPQNGNNQAYLYFDNRRLKDGVSHQPDGATCSTLTCVQDDHSFVPCGCETAALYAVTLRSASSGRSTINVTQERAPAVLWGAGSGSGTAILRTQPLAGASNRFLLFMGDYDTLDVAEVTSGAALGSVSWHRLDGPDPSDLCLVEGPRCNGSQAAPRSRTRWDDLVHMDHFGIAFTPDFQLRLGAPAVVNGRTQYAQNTSLMPGSCRGTMTLANDGGVYRSRDCGQTWTPAERLETLGGNELAGVASATGLGLYFGAQDNESWVSLDGGRSWRVGEEGCGDCAGYWADPLSPRPVLHFGRFYDLRYYGVVSSLAGVLTSLAADVGVAPSRTVAMPYESRPHLDVLNGYRPLLQALSPAEFSTIGRQIALRKLEDGDTPATAHVLLQSEDDGAGGVRWTQVGARLPASAAVVQGAGGTVRPTYYVGTGDGKLLRSFPVETASPSGWDCVFPGPTTARHDGACRAGSSTMDIFFVHPYEPKVLYLSVGSSMAISTDGGSTQSAASSLDALLGDGGNITQQDDGRWHLEARSTTRRIEWMAFVPGEPRTRFAVGQAGVFMTTDGLLPGSPAGATETWHRVLDARAMPCAPSAAFFDPGFGVRERSLYVTCNGRGLLRLHPIPQEGTTFTVRSIRPH